MRAYTAQDNRSQHPFHDQFLCVVLVGCSMDLPLIFSGISTSMLRIPFTVATTILFAYDSFVTVLDFGMVDGFTI